MPSHAKPSRIVWTISWEERWASVSSTAEHKGAAVVSGVQPVEDRSAGPSDMEETGGARSKTYADPT